MARFLALLLLAFPLQGKWWRLSSGPITLFTDGGERIGRETLDRLDLARRVYAGLWRNPGSLPLPVVAFALTFDQRFRVLRPSAATSAYFQSASQRDYVVICTKCMDASRAVFHEYFHLVMTHISGPLPQWLEEGLAEFHSTLEAADNRVRLGKPIASHLRFLAVTPLMRAEDMIAVRKDSPEYNENSKAGLFYAQSWALTHMLKLDEKYRERFPVFLASLAAGDSQTGAFQKAFGKSFSEAVSDLKLYLDRPTLPVVDLRVELEPASSTTQVSEIDDYEGDLAYAELAVASSHPEEADKIYRRLMRNRPIKAREANALGLVALGQKNFPEALKYFEMAMQFPDTPAETYFEYAMLVRDTNGDRAVVQKNLEKAAERNPQFAEAHFLLGVAAANENKHAEAVEQIEKALRVFPRQSYFWHALAVSYHALGREEPSRKAAQRALDSASNSDEAQMAAAALRLTEEKVPARKAAKGPDVITPPSWNNKEGDKRSEGLLQRIDCVGDSARFHVQVQGKLIPLWVSKPGDVLLKNLSSMTFEFRCGTQKPRPVVVEYKAKLDAQTKTEGEITALEFR